jgi:hypothetical protein
MSSILLNGQKTPVKKLVHKDILKIDDILVEHAIEGNKLYMVEEINKDNVMVRSGPGDLIKMYFNELFAKEYYCWLYNPKNNIRINHMLV